MPYASIIGMMPATAKDNITDRAALNHVSIYSMFSGGRTYSMAARASVLRECNTSTTYAVEGLRTSSSCCTKSANRSIMKQVPYT